MNRRVVVTSPRMRARRVVRRPIWRDIEEQTELGDVYLRSIISTQLRLGLIMCGAVAGLLFCLPLLFAAFPAIAECRLLGIPLPWFVLTFCVQPLWLGLAWQHVRRAERAEHRFAELVERS